MLNWFKSIIQKYKSKLLQQYLNNLYLYTIRHMILDLIILYDNTWDKDKVKTLIIGLQSINLDAYAKDEELHKIIHEKFKYK